MNMNTKTKLRQTLEEELPSPLARRGLRTVMKITQIETEPNGRIVLKLEGQLAGLWVNELEEAWRRALEMSPGQDVAVDLSQVTFIDEEGRKLLERVHQAGSPLFARGCLTRSIVDKITGQRPRPRRLRRLAGLLVALALLGVPARAQQTPVLRLTLRQAVALALRQNPGVRIAELTVSQAEQDRSIARAGLLPQADLEVPVRAERANIRASFGRTVSGFPEHIGPFEIFQAGSGFSLPIFDLPLWRQWQAAGHRLQASAADRRTTREETTLVTVSQYLTALRATADVRAAESRLSLAQALYDQAVDLQKHGVSTGLDTLRANVQLQNEAQRLIRARTDLRIALYALVRLLNLPPDQPIELADALSFYQTPAFAAAETIGQALATRPEMKALDERERNLEAEQRAVGEQRLPSIHFVGNWAEQGLSATTVIPTYVYQVDVRVPIVTGGRLRAERIRARLALEQVEQQKLDLRNQIAYEVKTAIAELDSARHEVDVANLGVKLAAAEVQQARDRFAAGVANNIEVITAQDELARANDNQIGALFRYNQARASLSRAIGRMQGLYLH
jgi:outer membrane protein